MSEENDKDKNVKDSVAVNNAVPNNENIETPLNTENIKTSASVPDVQNIPNSSVNTVKYQSATPAIRRNIVAKATEFLVNDRIRNTPIERKVNFLRARGLTDTEIQVAFQNSAIICNDNQNACAPTTDIPTANVSDYIYSKPSGVSENSQSWLGRFVGPVAFGATAIYFAYQIYKKYVENWLFGMQMSPVEKRLEVVELLVQKCIVLVEEKNKSESSSEHINRQKELDQIRAELKSIKSLLLNRFQFPPAPASSTIPQWQLVKKSKPQEPNLSPISILSGTNSALVVPLTIDGLVSNTIKNNNCPFNNSMPNRITLSSNSDHHSIISNDAVVQNNGDVKLNNRDGK